MSDLAALKDIRDKLAKATGPDRFVDYLMDGLSDSRVLVRGLSESTIAQQLEYRTSAIRELGDLITPDSYLRVWPEYTSSLDACVMLAERVLPGWWDKLQRSAGPIGAKAFYICELSSLTATEPYEMKRVGIAETRALAFLTAIISALIAKAEAHKDSALSVEQGHPR